MLVCLHFFLFFITIISVFFLLFSGQTVSKLISNRLADESMAFQFRSSCITWGFFFVLLIRFDSQLLSISPRKKIT